jgi:hypothetical protein
MKTNRSRLAPALIVLPLALALAAAAGERALADPRRDAQKEYAAPVPSGSASAPPPEPEPEATDGGKRWVPAMDVSFPEGTSDPPANADWATAPAATEVRVTEPGCRVQRIREWYRVTCHFAQRIELISGTREALTFGCTGQTSADDFCSEGWAMFPAKRGDRRALQVFTWGKWGPSPESIVTEQFLEGDPLPLVTVAGLHWGF